MLTYLRYICIKRNVENMSIRQQPNDKYNQKTLSLQQKKTGVFTIFQAKLVKVYKSCK